MDAGFAIKIMPKRKNGAPFRSNRNGALAHYFRMAGASMGKPPARLGGKGRACRRALEPVESRVSQILKGFVEPMAMK